MLAADRDPARHPASLHRPQRKAQRVPGGGSGSQQRQAALGAPFAGQQAAESLQRFDQAQTVAGLELPGQRLVTAVDRRCAVAGHPGQAAQVVAGAGGIRRQTALSRVADRLLVPASRVAVAALQLGQLAE